MNMGMDEMDEALQRLEEANEDLVRANEQYHAQIERLTDECAEKCAAKDSYINTLIERKNKALQQIHKLEERLSKCQCTTANSERT